MIRRILALASGLVLLAVLGACAPAATAPTPATQATTAATKPAGTPAASATKPVAKTVEKIKYTTPTTGLSQLPMQLGKDKGIFAEEGLDPEFLAVRSTLGIASLLKGEVEYVGVITEALLAAMAGEPIRMLMVQKSKASWHIILGQGITTAQQLKGKPIGVSSVGGANQYAAEKGLVKLGVDPKDVTFVAVGDKETLAALKNGSIGATVITPPFSDMAVDAGFKEILNTSDVVDMATTGVSTTVKRIQENPDQVKRLMRALLRSLAYVRDNQEEAIKFAMKQYELERPIAEKVVREMSKEFAYDGNITDQAIGTTLDLMKAGDGPGKNATLQQLKDSMDFGPLRTAQKELGLSK